MSRHPIVHVEIPANNPAESSKFYNSLFDWNIEVDERFNYHQFDPGSTPSGAFVNVGVDSSGANEVKVNEPLVYVGTDDVTATLNRAAQLGAKVVTPQTEIPGMGWYGIFEDPTGNKVGLFQTINPQG